MANALYEGRSRNGMVQAMKIAKARGATTINDPDVEQIFSDTPAVIPLTPYHQRATVGRGG